MNVLIFVVTMIMILTLLTYAKLETFRSSQVFQVLFENYMEKDERSHINLAAKKKYDSIKKTEKSKKEKKEDKPAKSASSPRISLELFKNKSARETKPQDWNQTKHLLKNLLNVLYKDQPFFVKLQNERPQFLEDLINSMTQAIDDLPKEKQLKKAQDFGNLSLNDPQLDALLYKILKGAPYKDVSKKEDSEETSSGETSEEASDPTIGVDEYKSIKGYYSLLDFVTLSPNQKIRIYLASREVLQAIFLNEQVVDDVITERKALYRQLNAEASPEDLKKTFQSRFEGNVDPTVKESVDYTVSKTNPKNYE